MPPKQTHCIRGHEFTPGNTYVAPNTGNRGCRTCRRDDRIRRQAEAKANPRPKALCLVDECGRPSRCRLLCRTHYERQRAGQPDWDRPVPKRRDGWPAAERLMDQRRLELVVPELGECWRFTGSHTGGYGDLVDDRRKGGTVKAHVVAYREWVGEVPDGLLVRHKCDVRDCFRPDHLLIGTVADNNNDAVERGRVPRGIKKWGAKLTDDDVRAIRVDLRPVVIVAKAYGVSSTTISHIKSRKKWADVEESRPS